MTVSNSISSFDVLSKFPKKPYCSNDLKSGVVIRSRESALKLPYIQLNDLYIKGLLLDIDHGDAPERWLDHPGPAPSWVAVSRDSGRSHYCWLLKSAIPKTDNARIKPLRYFSLIEYNLGRVFRADSGYAGLLTKNPFSDHWRVFWPGAKSYDLAELTQGLDLEEKPRNINTGVGRNVSLFDSGRFWAYKAISQYWRPGGLPEWQKAVLGALTGLNTFKIPLPDSEVFATSKSIASWTWKNLTPLGKQELISRTRSPEIQSERGVRSGQARRQKREHQIAKLKELQAYGLSINEICQYLSISERTFFRGQKT